VSWGTPSYYMNKVDGDQRDAIHLSNDGYNPNRRIKKSSLAGAFCLHWVLMK